MSKPDPTTAELRRAGIITGAEIARAGAHYEADPASTYTFGSGHALDLAAAVAAHQKTVLALADPKSPANFRRAMVTTAIMLACPKAP